MPYHVPEPVPFGLLVPVHRRLSSEHVEHGEVLLVAKAVQVQQVDVVEFHGSFCLY